jgi:hypothetical protein
MPLLSNTSLATLTARECSPSSRLSCTLSSKFSPSSICISNSARLPRSILASRVLVVTIYLASAVTKLTFRIGGWARWDAIERVRSRGRGDMSFPANEMFPFLLYRPGMSEEEKRKIRQAWDSAKRAQRIEIPGVRYNYFSAEEQRRQDHQARRGRRIAVGVLVLAATLGLGGWRFFSGGACNALGGGYINSAGVWSRHSWGTCNYHGDVKNAGCEPDRGIAC